MTSHDKTSLDFKNGIGKRVGNDLFIGLTRHDHAFPNEFPNAFDHGFSDVLIYDNF